MEAASTWFIISTSWWIYYFNQLVQLTKYFGFKCMDMEKSCDYEGCWIRRDNKWLSRYPALILTNKHLTYELGELKLYNEFNQNYSVLMGLINELMLIFYILGKGFDVDLNFSIKNNLIHFRDSIKCLYIKKYLCQVLFASG